MTNSNQPNTGPLMSLRMLSGAMIGAIAVLAVVIVVIAPDVVMPPLWVTALVLGLVAAATLVSIVLVGSVPAAEQGEPTSSLMAKVQSVHILRLALMEAPVIIAIVLMFLSPEPSWVTVAMAAVPTLLLMLLLVFPHDGVLRRYEQALDAGGVRTQFTDRLHGRVA